MALVGRVGQSDFKAAADAKKERDRVAENNNRKPNDSGLLGRVADYPDEKLNAK